MSLPLELAPLVAEITELTADATTAYRAAYLAEAAAGQRLIELRRQLGRVGWQRWISTHPRERKVTFERAMRAAASL